MSDQYFDFFTPPLKEQKLEDTVFTALDFETTGLYPDSDRVIEVGILKFDLKGEIDSFETLINPGRHIPSESSKISGISNDMVKDSPVMADVFKDIVKFIDGSLVIAHNINFDYSFLKKEAQLLGEEFKLDMGVDTVNLSRKALKGYQSYSLQNLAKYLHLSAGNAHRALDDSRLCMQLFLKALPNIENSSGMTVKELFLYSNTRLK
ncbi:MAG: 3'-5' exonuclease [Spirochaetales bacterium]|nr:3'-5' exonuclease [Spirochaetales bacterium]